MFSFSSSSVSKKKKNNNLTNVYASEYTDTNDQHEYNKSQAPF